MATKLAPRKNYSLSGIGTDADPFKIAANGVRSNELENIAGVEGTYESPANIEIDGQGRVIAIEDGGSSSGGVYGLTKTTRGHIIAKTSSATYAAPGSVGSPGILTIDKWANFKSLFIQVDDGLDYNSGNPFVLNIVDSSGNSNNWDPSDNDPAFDLVVPTVQVMDAGATTTPLFLQQTAAYGTSEGWKPDISWLAGTLILTFNKTQFLGKSRNIIKISL